MLCEVFIGLICVLDFYIFLIHPLYAVGPAIGKFLCSFFVHVLYFKGFFLFFAVG